MVEARDLVGEEWAEWYRLTPAQRWVESQKLWETYLILGGSLDPEPDTQSPFFDPGDFQNQSSAVPRKKFLVSKNGEKISLV